MISQEDSLDSIIEQLGARLGRWPTEDEVYNFIFGDYLTKFNIWNSGKELICHNSSTP